MDHLLDLQKYPLDRLDAPEGQALITRCREELEQTGMFNLDGLVREEALAASLAALKPAFATGAYTHARRHNIYFRRDITELDSGHPALTEFETVNHTLCADQIAETPIMQIYAWPPLAAFLAAVMDKQTMHVMADPLARVNVMRYGAGEALNWHFDRSEFTTTLLLQAPGAGGVFQYAHDLRSDEDPNYDGVARLIAGEMPVSELRLTPGTLNVFRGKNTAHRVTPVEEGADRVIAVFSYYDRPGVMFSDDERIGFYGRAA